MRILKSLLISSLLVETAFAAQLAMHSGLLQWSQAKTIKSPNHRFRIEVHPILTDAENHSPVVVRALADHRTWRLFTLTRSAQAEWSPDSQRILIIDQPTSDRYYIRLFTTDGKSVGADSDNMVRSEVIKMIGPERTTEFYLPTFVSWNRNEVLLAVGGTSSRGINKPMEPYCFGVRIDDVSVKVLNTFSKDALKQEFNSTCRTSP